VTSEKEINARQKVLNLTINFNVFCGGGRLVFSELCSQKMPSRRQKFNENGNANDSDEHLK
jgi:hypothetical protein